MDVYRANPNIVYARIEHETESGTYRSDDAGLTWRRMASSIYVLGVQLHISDDGGKTFVDNGTIPRGERPSL